MEDARVDQWLWAVRIAKTRSSATALCRAGHVQVDGVSAKPAVRVRPGSRVEVRVGDRERVLEVVRAIDKRVGAPVAAGCLVDHSPPVVPRALVPDVFAREPGAGRPTKRDRRDLDRLRSR